jgi:hypothetical protein
MGRAGRGFQITGRAPSRCFCWFETLRYQITLATFPSSGTAPKILKRCAIARTAQHCEMPRLARIEPAIDRLLHRVRGRRRALDTDAIARDVYGVEASGNPTASQRAVVTRAMRDFVRGHQAYALAAGRGRTALYIVPADAERLPDWLAFPRPPIKPPPAPPSWAHNALDLLEGVLRTFSHWQLRAEMPPELRAQLQQAELMLLELVGSIEDYARRPQR